MRTCPACHNPLWKAPHTCTDGPMPAILAVMEDGTQRTLTFEEWQDVEPAMYEHEAGAWCVAEEDDSYYFVSQDGRVDVHDGETFAVVQFDAGKTKDAHDRMTQDFWDEQAAEEKDRRQEVDGTGMEDIVRA